MEYLLNVTDETKTIDETGYKYVSVFERPDIVYGVPFFESKGFYKYNKFVDEMIAKTGEASDKSYNNFKSNCSGCFLKFRTKSKYIILKAELKRKRDYKNINLYNSSGFDIYEFANGEYVHKTVVAPKTGKSIFAERIANDPQNELCIFLPTYNEIYDLYIGTRDEIETVNPVNRPAIAFYGNSITQGAAASRSGNAFVNIVARELNNEVYNYSISNGCRGITAVADIIGTLNLRAIVIDYTRNCSNLREFTKTYPTFYNRIRSFHKDTPIILMTALTFQFSELLVNYNKIVEETFESARQAGQRTFLLNQEEAFTPYETDLKSIEGYHYTDYGMYRIAERIVEIIKNSERGSL